MAEPQSESEVLEGEIGKSVCVCLLTEVHRDRHPSVVAAAAQRLAAGRAAAAAAASSKSGPRQRFSPAQRQRGAIGDEAEPLLSSIAHHGRCAAGAGKGRPHRGQGGRAAPRHSSSRSAETGELSPGHFGDWLWHDRDRERWQRRCRETSVGSRSRDRSRQQLRHQPPGQKLVGRTFHDLHLLLWHGY